MEHHQQQLLHLSPQQHIMISSGFFDVDPLHFDDGGFAEPVAAVAGIDDSGWMEDLMQLGDELFGVGGSGSNAAVDMVGDHQQHQAWQQQQQCEGGGSPEQPSFYDDVSPPPLAEADQGAGELARDDSDLSATRKRRDRSKTIVSERKRRFRMKEKLYELRALVPNITKMDKASIIADAVVYVKNLQSHARKLKEEVATLEARPGSPRQQQQQGRRAAGRRQGQHSRAASAEGRCGSNNDEGTSSGSGGARVTHVGAAQVGEGRFFVTVDCERRDGVAAPLCAAVESLACFRVESSNLGRSSDRFVSTLTLKVSEVGENVKISECTVKLWVMAALLKVGFRPEATVEIS